jgi:hypothetical protein
MTIYRRNLYGSIIFFFQFKDSKIPAENRNLKELIKSIKLVSFYLADLSDPTQMVCKYLGGKKTSRELQ